MSTERTPEIVLYDLGNITGTCFSPVVWRIRLILNYKGVPYETRFVEFPDIEPTLKALGIEAGTGPSGKPIKYTVPAIHHLPTDTRIMDSVPIAKFIEENYPEPRLAPWDPASDELVLRMRSSIGPVLQASILPREPHILSPRSQEYFRRTRETQFGVALESLAEGDKEDKAWSAIDADLHTASDVLLAALAKGPFASGDLPGMRDFFVAGSMESARIVDKGVFGRIFAYRGFQDVYKACQPWMEKRD